MPAEFQYDVFLSHSAKDKAVVRPHPKAEGRSMKDESNALRSVFASDRLYPCVSALHHSAFILHPFPCASLNQERGFIPLRLDDAPIKGSLAQFLYINWRPILAGSSVSHSMSE
jgi:hypothetical protein